MKNSNDDKSERNSENSRQEKNERDEILLEIFPREKCFENESPEEKSRLLPGNETKLMICFCANMVLKHKIEILIELGWPQVTFKSKYLPKGSPIF